MPTMKTPRTEEFISDGDGGLTHSPTRYHIDKAENENFPNWDDYKEFEVKQVAKDILRIRPKK
jgi:hypothetical protein